MLYRRYIDRSPRKSSKQPLYGFGGYILLVCFGTITLYWWLAILFQGHALSDNIQVIQKCKTHDSRGGKAV